MHILSIYIFVVIGCKIINLIEIIAQNYVAAELTVSIKVAS